MPAFQIISDLHLEVRRQYGWFKITLTAPYLVLLGDIGLIQQDLASEQCSQTKKCFKTPERGILRKMIFRLLKQYRIIFYIPGNHEPYYTTWPAVEMWLENTAAMASARSPELGQFVAMMKNRFDFRDENFTLLGCTLFSDIPQDHYDVAEKGVNDFRKGRIKGGWSVAEHVETHRAHLAWLNAEVKKAEEEGRKVAILTHHSPTVDNRAVEERYRNDVVLSAYSTDLSLEPCWTSQAVKLWAFGHTHYNCDFVDQHGKRVFTNQKGDINSKGWDPQKVVVV